MTLDSLIQFTETKIQMLQKGERLEKEGDKQGARAIFDEWMHSNALLTLARR